MENTKLESFLEIENIDRKCAEFKSTTSYHSTLDDIYSDPEVIIIKNDHGRVVFNALVKLFDYKEKGVVPITQDINYPYYILTCDWITAGCRFGMWRYFEDIESLQKEVDIDSLQDDFDNFRELLLGLLVNN